MAITPYLLYEDVDAALKFLSKAFGFEEYGESFRGEDGKLSHAAMKCGKGVVMMGCPGPKYKNPNRSKQRVAVMQYVDVKDVDAHFERAKKAGAKILEEPQNTPYGARRYGAEDPQGHQWYFAAPLPKRATKKTSGKC